MQKRLAAVLALCFLAPMGCAEVNSSQGQEGAEGGRCYPNGTCDSGLVCLSDTCVAPTGGGGTGGGGGIGGDGGNGGNGGGVACGDGLEPDFYAECMAESCCAELDACFADEPCATCLTTAGPECETNTQFTTLLACGDEACPLSFCGSGVGFFGVNDPIACNTCIDAECCAPFDACAGGVDQPDLEACLACVEDPSGATCQSAPADTQTAAAEFAACTDTSCSAPCAE